MSTREEVLRRYEFEEKYEEYQIVEHGRQAHRRPDSGHRRRSEKAARAEVADISDSHQDWVPTYAAALDPRHHERQFVIDSVASFYRDEFITDVTQIVKGGKEANVYCCEAHPGTGQELVAAKLYRPRMLRHLKNDAVYKAGRVLRGEDGKLMKGRREKLALLKKTNFGKEVDIAWWIGNEYSVQQRLFDAGADVPRPLAFSGNAILMAYVGDAMAAAPLLRDVRLAQEEARPLFERVMANVALMLDHHYVHSDLSAYNILYWEGDICIIDFPQVVEARHNPHAFALLKRDVTRICDYFARYGVAEDPHALTVELWEPYMGRSD